MYKPGQEAEEVRPGAALLDHPVQKGQRCFGLLHLPVNPEEVGERPKVGVPDRRRFEEDLFRLPVFLADVEQIARVVEDDLGLVAHPVL